MSAIDELCRMLDERGVEYEGGKRSLRWRDRYGIMMQAFPLANGELGMGVWSCTPEQAIAATLGWGKLSASQVSNAVYAHSIHADCADADWQAIADELNATLGSCNCSNNERTSAACKPTAYDNGYSTDHLEPGEYYEFWEPACACGNCGELIPMRKFCPNCGSRLEVDDG